MMYEIVKVKYVHITRNTGKNAIPRRNQNDPIFFSENLKTLVF